MDQPFQAFDIGRILMGEAQPLFLLEVLVRTLIVYGYTLLLLRWIGGRTVAQLSMVEFLLVIALGSAVGDSLFYPDVPLVPALLAVTVVVLVNKGLDLAIIRWQRAKNLVDGLPVIAIEGGRIHVATLDRDGLGPDEFLSRLRIEGVRNLGEIETAFIEPDGRVSVFRRAEPAPGLRIAPPHELHPPQPLEDPALAPGGMACCVICGGLSPAPEVVPDGACPYCASHRWTAPES
ncbi:DUF421 domain-containing protein [Amaricoccus solimangrovi]|uniref:DUF421 domain-containing protein n=1 Tax=Amaricoccus solimangrovi TaxID=2589815 RepID=A0A501X1C1_9RHOB|nr:YetF domain-containing protein [Amaricoccus solimangrovi]TPE53666.1 DUF421 domain-containing protein [Amaricoccus solimangrovi]